MSDIEETTAQGNPEAAAALETASRPAVGRAYAPPRIIHEAELETRAGTPLGPILDGFEPGTGVMRNPWDPDYTTGPGQ